MWAFIKVEPQRWDSLHRGKYEERLHTGHLTRPMARFCRVGLVYGSVWPWHIADEDIFKQRQVVDVEILRAGKVHYRIFLWKHTVVLLRNVCRFLVLFHLEGLFEAGTVPDIKVLHKKSREICWWLVWAMRSMRSYSLRRPWSRS